MDKLLPDNVLPPNSRMLSDIILCEGRRGSGTPVSKCCDAINGDGRCAMKGRNRMCHIFQPFD